MLQMKHPGGVHAQDEIRSLLHEVYDAGHHCFDENYIQELIEKAHRVRFAHMFYMEMLYWILHWFDFCICISKLVNFHGLDKSGIGVNHFAIFGLKEYLCYFFYNWSGVFMVLSLLR